MGTDLSEHGRCKTHEVYELDCGDLDRLRARAAGRCELCGILEQATRHGRLHIDHDARHGWHAVRGLLCSPCNTWLGRCEERLRKYGTPLTAEQLRYLSKPFWREPESQASIARRVEGRERRQATLLGLEDAVGRRRPGARLSNVQTAAIRDALSSGIRQADVMRAARVSQALIYRVQGR